MKNLLSIVLACSLVSLVAIGATKTVLVKQEEAITESGVQKRASDPGAPVSGQFWWRTDTKSFKYYDGSNIVDAEDGVSAVSAISGTDINWNNVKSGGLFTKTLSANTTFTFSNLKAGKAIVVRLTNTASNYTVTWPTVKWTGAVTPTMTIGAKSDVYTFIYDGTDVYGSYVQDF